MPWLASSWRRRSPSSRRRRRIASCQCVSVSAASATCCAGPLTVHGPSMSASLLSSSGWAATKPRRSPARPKNLPTERSTMSPGWPACGPRPACACVSPNASSTTSQPPRWASLFAQSSSTSGAMRAPVGLFGLQTTITSQLSTALASCAYGTCRKLWPCWPQWCACSAYEGAATTTQDGARSRGKAWMAACVPATGSMAGA